MLLFYLLVVKNNFISCRQSTYAVDILRGNCLEQTNIEKCSARNVESDSVNFKKKKELNLPRRSSKGLAGFEPELVPDSKFHERALFNST